MTSRRHRGALAPLLIVGALVIIAGCGRSSGGESVGAGRPASTATPAAGPTTTTTAAGASPVANLTPMDLRRVVEAAGTTPTRALRGPVAERITVGDRTVWRIRIPGRFEARSARVRVSVGGTVVGAGMVAPHLDALVAVTADPALIVRGAPVTYQWEGSQPVAAGPLAVTA
jgi:hypothetical protein